MLGPSVVLMGVPFALTTAGRALARERTSAPARVAMLLAGMQGLAFAVWLSMMFLLG